MCWSGEGLKYKGCVQVSERELWGDMTILIAWKNQG
jgi:hypothetical protein